jgi:hypothetical protein
MTELRDLTDPDARRYAGAACLVQYRDEWEARAESDCWTADWTVESDTETARAIDWQQGRVADQIFKRVDE